MTTSPLEDSSLGRVRARAPRPIPEASPGRDRLDARARVVIRFFHEEGIDDIEGSSRCGLAARSLEAIRDRLREIEEIAARARGLCAWARESDPGIREDDELDAAIETIEAVAPLARELYLLLPRVRDRGPVS